MNITQSPLGTAPMYRKRAPIRRRRYMHSYSDASAAI